MQLGRFTQLEEVGRGGMGVVYRAVDPTTQRTVALKLLQAVSGGTAARRLEREAEALRRVSHPGVVRLHELGELDAGLRYLVMDWVEGESLQARLDRLGPLPVPEAVAVARQVCEALRACHRVGVLHRDLKPDNVIRASDGRLKLIDFGLARDMDPALGRSQLTKTGTFLGSPHYWAPEQARGEVDAVGVPTDVYGVGGLLYALLTGSPPHPGESLIEALAAASSPKPPPSRRSSAVPRWLDEVVLRALAVEPAARYPDCEALSAALAEGATGTRVSGAGQRALAAGFVLAGLAVAAALLASRSTPARPPAEVAGTPSPSPAEIASATPSPTPALYTLELAPGPWEGEDTYVLDGGLYVNDNYGGHARLKIGSERLGAKTGRYRAYLRFGLERLPADAAIELAQLELHSLGEAGPATIQARYARAAWIEGTSSADEELDGVAWSGDLPGQASRFLDSDRPDLDQPGFDPDEAPIDEVRVPAGDPLVILDLTAAARSWQVQARPNYGVCLTGVEREEVLELRDLASSDAAQVELRPRLVIRYLGSPPVAALPDHLAEREARYAQRIEAATRLLHDEQPDGLVAAHALVNEAIVDRPDRHEGFFLRARLFVRQSSKTQPRGHRAVTACQLGLHRVADPTARQALRALTLEALRLLEVQSSPSVARAQGLVLLQEAPEWPELRAYLRTLPE